MVAGGYYKLSLKTDTPNGHCELEQDTDFVLKNKCLRVCRWKVIIFVLFLLLVIILLCLYVARPVLPLDLEPHAFNPITKPVSIPPVGRSDHGTKRIRYKHTQRRLPNCLIIGARKAGTRALLTFLNLHPEILAAKQEVHFFDLQENYERGTEWYRKSMPYSFPEQITLEKTPAYFVTEEVPERVYRMNSTIKLLLILRDPVERAISDYTQIKVNKMEKNKQYADFEDFAINENGDVDKTYPAIKRSIYARHMAKWLRFFPLEQFHLVNGEGLVEDPLAYISAIEDFLGLEHRITAENFYFNETRGFYCIRNDTMEKCLNLSKGRAHPDIKPEVIRKLRAFFRPFNEKFYGMVHRNFGWM